MVILDTPGLLEPSHMLHRAMRQTARAALADADVIVYLLDPTDNESEHRALHVSAGLDHEPRAPVLTVFNKLDVLSDERRARLQELYPAANFISAQTGEGVDELMQAAATHLPESPFLYPEEDVSAQSVRFFVTELIRETTLELLEQEVPYGIACEIEEFREASKPVYIRAVLHVERDSQKGIVVGARGARIREIGRLSRIKIEELVGASVYLDLWVKVLPDWSRNKSLLKRLGYNVSEE